MFAYSLNNEPKNPHLKSEPQTDVWLAEIINIIDSCEEQTSVNPSLIYCQQTGAPIGRLDYDEFAVMLSMIPSMDLESLCDDLFARTIMSMRPSPAMNYMRDDTIESLRLAYPHRLCAFLLGRYFRPRDRHYDRLKRSYDSIMDDGRRQIEIFRFASQLQFGKVDSHDWFMHCLLEIDARFDLSLLDSMTEIPTVAADLDISRVDSYVEAMKSIIIALQARKDKLEKEASLHNSWLASGGSRLVRKAYVKSFFAMNPESTKTEAAQERNQRKRDLRIMMATMLEGFGSENPKPMPAPIAKPKSQSTFKLGKINFTLAKPKPSVPSLVESE